LNVLKILSLFPNRVVYLALSILTIILALEQVYLWSFVLLYQVFLWKKDPVFWPVSFLIGLVFFFRLGLVDDLIVEEGTSYEVQVLEVRQYEDYAVLIGKIKRDKVQLHYSGSHVFLVGQVYQMDLKAKENMEASIPFTFDGEAYRKGKKIKGQYQVSTYTMVRQGVHVNQIVNYVDALIEERCLESSAYVKTMILANNEDMDEKTMDQIRFLGISHLFAVSGLHIGLLVVMVRRLLFLFSSNPVFVDLSLTVFLLFYMVLTSFSPSVVRASLMVILYLLNKYKKWGLSSLDLVSIVFVCLLFVHPYFYLQVGFQLSFLMTFFIVLGKKVLKVEGKVKAAFFLSLLAFFSTLPFTLAFDQSLNLLTVFYNVVYLFFVMFAFLPMAYLSFLFPFLDGLYGRMIVFFEVSIGFFSKMDYFVFVFVINDWFYKVVYYVLWIGLLIGLETKRYERRLAFCFIFFLLCMLHQEKFVWYSSVHFVDVYGDATLIQSSFDACNVLVDTGSQDPYHGLITYLKNKHVKRIDYMIVSHHHEDHDGNLLKILEEFDVRHYIDANNVSNYQGGIVCGGVQMVFYETSRGHVNENNNSLIMSLSIEGDHYFFTGDMEEEMELAFIKNHQVGKVDKLKVAHHGSITSSSEAFLDYVNPKEAYMMVSLKNKHGHPSDVVVNRFLLRNIDLHRTDQLGTIEIRYFLEKEWKKTSK